jgi:hypothetical protein
MSITRDEIARLCAEHDGFLAECASEQPVRALVQKSDAGAGLVYRMTENEPAAAPVADAVLSDSDLAADDPLGYAMVKFTEACDRRFERLERENSYLRGQIDTLLAMLGKSEMVSNLKAADVLDLPDWRKRDVA